MVNILIIEDDNDIALQMKKYLCNNEYDVEIATSYYEAMDLIDRKSVV